MALEQHDHVKVVVSLAVVLFVFVALALSILFSVLFALWCPSLVSLLVTQVKTLSLRLPGTSHMKNGGGAKHIANSRQMLLNNASRVEEAIPLEIATQGLLLSSPSQVCEV